MSPAKLTLSITVALIGVMAAHVTHAAPNANVQIISFDAPGAGNAGYGQGTGCFGCTFAINQWGTVAGSYVDGNGVPHGFIRTRAGEFTTIDAPDVLTGVSGLGTQAQSINDWGEVTGYYFDVNFNEHGFLRSPDGTFTTFDVPGASYAVPVFINLEGAVVGYAYDANVLSHAFLRRPDGTYAVFVGPGSCTSGNTGNPPCYGNEATYVDLFGASIGGFMDNSGNFVTHGLIRSPNGTLTTFDAPGAGTGFYQGTGCPGCNLGVNFLGEIAGIYTDANYVFHGFLRGPGGKFMTFDAPGAGTGFYQGTGCPSDCPVGLNDRGEISGSYVDSNSTQHGYLRYPDGTFTTIDPPGSIGTQPESINDSGDIVGYYLDANLVAHGFLVLSHW